MEEYTFKHCSKGHYYQGDECPYCKAQVTPFGNSIVEDPIHDLGNLKTCPNGHAYGPRLNYCPYCGKTEIEGTVDLLTGWQGSLNVVFVEETYVKVCNVQNKVSELEIFFLWGYGYKTNYKIIGMPNFDYRSIIQIGKRSFTGKEFIKWVDLMINVKEIKHSL